jgi:hypothetical protein
MKASCFVILILVSLLAFFPGVSQVSQPSPAAAVSSGTKFIAKVGDALPGHYLLPAGSAVDQLSPPDVNNTGYASLYFQADLGAPQPCGVAMGDGTPSTPPNLLIHAVDGETTSDGALYFCGQIAARPLTNNNGAIAYAANVGSPTGQKGLYLSPGPGSPIKIVKEGTDPGPPPHVFGPPELLDLNDVGTYGTVLFKATIDGVNTLFSSTDGSSLNTLVQEGDTPSDPSAGGGTIATLGSAVMDNSGNVAFQATLTGGTVSQAIFLRNTAGGLTRVVAAGDIWFTTPALDISGAEESGGECDNALDDDGDGRINDGCPPVNVDPETKCRNSLDDDGDTKVNDGCSAEAEVRFQTVSEPAINDKGVVAFKATLPSPYTEGYFFAETRSPHEDGNASCFDGIDNGGDGATDSGDTDCTASTDPHEDGNASCSDNLDNASDGVADNNDPDCQAAQAAVVPENPSALGFSFGGDDCGTSKLDGGGPHLLGDGGVGFSGAFVKVGCGGDPVSAVMVFPTYDAVVIEGESAVAAGGTGTWSSFGNPTISENGRVGFGGTTTGGDDGVATAQEYCDDSDGDGLCDGWEDNGIDTNNDGTADLLLPGADKNKKDIYVEIDYMDCDQGGCESEDGFGLGTCGDGIDNGGDGPDVINGGVDVAAPWGTINSSDDGSVAGLDIVDGYVDIDEDGATPPDSDDDGAIAGEEVINGGVDINDDGKVDGNDDGTLGDAADNECTVVSTDRHYHKPIQAAIDNVVTAFANSTAYNPTDSEDGVAGGCNDGVDNGGADGFDAADDDCTGITLHVTVDDAIPHYQYLDFPATGVANPKPCEDGVGGIAYSGVEPYDFNLVKNAWFGTEDERTDSNWKQLIKPAKQKVYHYALFTHMQAPDNSSSGCAEIHGNDFYISLGAWSHEDDAPPFSPLGKPTCDDGRDNGGDGDTDEADSDCIGDNVTYGTRGEQEGTFMHELGHNLGLEHGGDDELNYKPNYLSVMNYTFQMPYIVPNRPLDYSRWVLPPPVEDGSSSLNSCTDGSDNGGGDGVDWGDPDCWKPPALQDEGFRGIVNSCGDNIDNDIPADNLIDFEDPDCRVGRLIEFSLDENEGIDRTLMASALSGYQTAYTEFPNEFGVDTDGDTSPQDLNMDTVISKADNEKGPGPCNDNIDNDGDTKCDLGGCGGGMLADPGCVAAGAAFALVGEGFGSCTDGVDNDRDGLIDTIPGMADPDCECKFRLVPATGNIDWNINNSIEGAGLSLNVDTPIKDPKEGGIYTCTTAVPNQILEGWDDWHNLKLHFRNSANYSDGLPSVPVPEEQELPPVPILATGPVGGTAELPDMSDSAAFKYYVVLAALAAAAVLALGAGAWCARRRWLG